MYERSIELHVKRVTGERMIIILPDHYSLETASQVAKYGVERGLNMYADIFMNGKFCGGYSVIKT